MYITREGKVAAFYKVAEDKTAEEGGSFLRVTNQFSEELAEFAESLSDYMQDPTAETRQAMIKEWADVQYTLSAFPWFFGFNGEEAFNRVADNNMTKVVDGVIVRRDDGKILKPDNYKPADMYGL